MADVDAAFSAIGAVAGKGSQARRAELIGDLFAAATEPEQVFLRRLLGGELRQGALAGVMADAVARAGGIPATAVRRAAMLGGDLPGVAAAALTGGAAALADFTLRVGRPVGPMLAQTSTGVGDALHRLGGEAVFEAKLDGARVQIHRSGDEVTVYTRSLDDVTAWLPEVVEATLALPVTDLIADGEAIALRPDLRPHRFQVTASRFGRSVDVAAARAAQPLSVFFFDVLHLDGTDLLDEPAHVRAAALDAVVPPHHRVDRLVTADTVAAQEFLDRTLAAGHEGVMAKSLSSPYEAGRRGAGWLRSSRCIPWIWWCWPWVGLGAAHRQAVNIHLGARDPAGGFVMLGKTFKGMTDAMLDWQTARFTELAAGPSTSTWCRCAPSRSSRSRSTAFRVPAATPAGWRCRFAGWCAIATTRARRGRHRRHRARPLRAGQLDPGEFGLAALELGQHVRGQRGPDLPDRVEVVRGGGRFAATVAHLPLERRLRALAGRELDVGRGEELRRAHQPVDVDMHAGLAEVSLPHRAAAG